MISRLQIIVTGLIAQHRLLGGVAWDYLNFILGLHQLGHDVYYVEDSGQWPYNSDGGPSGTEWVATDCGPTVEHLDRVMTHFGLADRWAYRFPPTESWFGLADAKRAALLESADLLMNVSGTLEWPEHYRRVKRLAYIDTDPVFTQLLLQRGPSSLKRRVDLHDVHFTVGECLPESMAATGHRWIPTKHPIALSEWSPSATRRDTFTTVMSWTSYEPLLHNGDTYGQKDVELMQFLALPSRMPATRFEVALASLHHIRWQSEYTGLPAGVSEFIRDRAEWTPRELLSGAGWQVVDSAEACPDFAGYRRYIESSRAEWSVAKNGYVRARSGWFSGRSACYLAAGRPVVVQDTGFASALPVGEGVLRFSTFDEAVAAVQDVEDRYDRHAEAARAIAEQHFDSATVLNRLISISMES